MLLSIVIHTTRFSMRSIYSKKNLVRLKTTSQVKVMRCLMRMAKVRVFQPKAMIIPTIQKLKSLILVLVEIGWHLKKMTMSLTIIQMAEVILTMMQKTILTRQEMVPVHKTMVGKTTELKLSQSIQRF